MDGFWALPVDSFYFLNYGQKFFGPIQMAILGASLLYFSTSRRYVKLIIIFYSKVFSLYSLWSNAIFRGPIILKG
jgi:hypothetical protein